MEVMSHFSILLKKIAIPAFKLLSSLRQEQPSSATASNDEAHTSKCVATQDKLIRRINSEIKIFILIIHVS